MINSKCGVRMVNVTDFIGRMGRNKGRQCFGLAETTSQAKAWSQECAMCRTEQGTEGNGK